MRIEILGMGCPKCKKLYEVIQLAVKELKIQAEVTKIEDIAKITDYGVWSTPAIVVDGEVKATGKIPSIEEIKNMLRE